MRLLDIVDTAAKITEEVSNVRAIFDSKNITKRIPRIMCILSASILTFTFLQQYWNILDLVNVEPFPMFSDQARNAISRWVSPCGVIWLIYNIVAYKILLRMVVKIDTLKKTTYIRFLETVDDIFAFFASGVFLLYAIDELLFFVNNGVLEFQFKEVFYCSWLYLGMIFVGWIFQKNNVDPYTAVTGYCDSNNCIIKEGNLVCYFNKLYRVEDGSKTILGFKNDPQKDSYILNSLSLRHQETILLSDAVKNREGMISIAKR